MPAGSGPPSGYRWRRSPHPETAWQQAQHDPGDAQQLLLPLGEIAAGFTDHRLVALGKALDAAVGVGLFGGGHDLPVGGVGLAQCDILTNGAGLQPGVLEDHADVMPQRAPVHLPCILTIQTDPAPIRIIEAHEQIDERGLAAAGGASPQNVYDV